MPKAGDCQGVGGFSDVCCLLSVVGRPRLANVLSAVGYPHSAAACLPTNAGLLEKRAMLSGLSVRPHRRSRHRRSTQTLNADSIPRFPRRPASVGKQAAAVFLRDRCMSPCPLCLQHTCSPPCLAFMCLSRCACHDCCLPCFTTLANTLTNQSTTAHTSHTPTHTHTGGGGHV